MSQAQQHIVPFRTFVLVWVALIVLTATTVAVGYIEMGAAHIWVSLTIAAIKSGLVIAYFMHMKYESLLFKGFLFCALATLAIFIGITFFDILYR